MEKKQQLRVLGDQVIEKRPSSIVDQANNNVKVAGALALQEPNSLLANQIESYLKAHCEGSKIRYLMTAKWMS